MPSKFIDLIKKLQNSTVLPGSNISLNPRNGRARRVQAETKPDFATGISGGSRPRYAEGEPDQMTKLRDEAQWLGSDPTHGRGGSVIAKPNRLKAALLGLLTGAGQAANRALETGQRDWGGVAQAVGAGVGGAATYGVDPGIVQRQRHAQAVAENQADQDREMQNLGNEAQLEDLKAQAEARRAESQYKATLPAKNAEDQRLREADIERKRSYNEQVLKIRADAAAGRIKVSEAAQKLRELELEEQKRHNLATESNTSGESKRGSAISKRDAYKSEADALYNKATNNEDNAKQLEAKLANINTTTYDGQTEYERVTKLIDELKREARDLRVKAESSRRQSEQVYVPSAMPSPETHTLSKSAWLASHPGGNLSEAIRVARARGYSIID